MSEKADWKSTPVANSDKSNGDRRTGTRVSGQETVGQLRDAIHEARADRADDGRRPTSGRTARCTSTRTTRTRRRCAARLRMMLGITVDNVVVRSLSRGRGTTGGRTAATRAPRTKP